jgi:invasion protein IalB
MRVTALIAMTFSIGCAGFAFAGDHPGFSQNRGSHGGEARTVTLDMIERDGGTPSILRVTFPLGMQIRHGARMIVEGVAPLRKPFTVCTISGCTSDFDITPAISDVMRSRQVLNVQAVEASGKVLTVRLPLVEFWAAHHAQQVIAEKTPEQRLKP